MGIADYLYNVVDAIPGERGGYADALVTLLGGDSRRQRRNQNIQAAMALFGANPSQQEIQAFADNEFQPAMPEGAGSEYGPRLNQLQETAQRNAGLVEAAQLATSAGSDSIKDVFDIWKMRQLKSVMDGQGETPLTTEQQVEILTDGKAGSAPWTNAGDGVIYNKFNARNFLTEKGKTEVGTELARQRYIGDQGNALQSRTASQNNLDRIRGNTQQELRGMYSANRGLTQEKTQLEAFKRQMFEGLSTIPGINTQVLMNFINGNSVTQSPQWFVTKDAKTGKSVRVMGTMDASGKPVVQQPSLNGQPVMVPKEERPKPQYQFQAELAHWKNTFPMATLEQLSILTMGNDMAKQKTLRDLQAASEEARAKKDRVDAEYNQESDLNNEGEDAAATAPAAAPGRAAGSGAGMSANPAALKRIAEQKKQQIIKEARDQNLSEAIIQYRLRLVDEQLARMLGK